MKSNWCSMRADKGAAEILIYDEIGISWFGGDGYTAKDFDRDLKALGDVSEILLRINSPGGDVFDGQAIYNTLKSHPAKITARIDAIAASAASLIVMAADRVEMPENAYLLVHEPYSFVIGGADDMRAAAGDLDRMTASFAGIYAKRTGGDEASIRALMKEDRLMSAAEALERGFADEVTDAVKMAASFDLRMLPAKARAAFAAKLETAADGNVVSIEEARAAAGRDARTHAAAIRDICKLARMPELAGDLIAEGKPVAEARLYVQTKRAEADEKMAISGHHAVPHDNAASKSWDKTIAALNRGDGL